MEELAQRLQQRETQVGQQRAVIEHQQEQLMRQQTTIDAERAARTPVITAQEARVNLVDLRGGNKPETFAGETHEWKGWSFKMRQYIAATIVTQQDQGQSGHRRVYLTTRVVARHGATPGCSGCVGLGPHTEARRVRLEKALADERADPVETPVRPITEPATESQEPAPAAQQEPASSSSGPAAPMPTQNLQNEQMDSPMENAENAKERGQARRQQVGTTRTQRTQRSAAKQEFEATETCTTEPQMHDGEQESIAVVDYEDPSATEAIEAYDAKTGVKLDSEEVRKGRAKEVRELDEFEVKMEVDESDVRSTPGKKIWSKWVETRKGPKQFSNTMSIVCCGSEHGRTEIRHVCGNPTFEIRATDFELVSELQAQASKRVDDHRCV